MRRNWRGTVSYRVLYRMLGPMDARSLKRILNLAVFYGYGGA